MTIENVLQAIKDENVIKDFYSGILIPVFGILIFIVVFVSIYGIIKNVLIDKKELIAIMRSLGLDAMATVIYLFVDFLILILVGVLLGLLLGSAIHLIIISVLNNVFNLSINNAFNVEIYVASVTVNPFAFSVIVVISCFILASVFPLFKFVSKSPAHLLQNTINKKKIRRVSPFRKIVSWKRILKERMSLFNFSVLLTLVIIMCALSFGYAYFSALSDMESNTLKSEKENYGLSYYDYLAETLDNRQMYTFNIENRHDYGVTKSTYDTLGDKPYVEEIFGEITNRSTRISYSYNDLTEGMKTYLSNISLRNFENTESEFEMFLRDAENAMISEIGYSDSEAIYSIPTIGLNEDVLDNLNLVAGTINMEAVNNGDEIILAVPENEKEQVLEIFNVGDEFPLSDIVLNDTEEHYDFAHLLTSDVIEPVYENEVVTDDGELVNLTSYAFGQRMNISTRIGAIVIIDTQIEDYLPKLYQYLDGFSDESGYGIYALCGVNAFTNWNLPDRNYTSFGIKVSEDYNINKVDEDWYSAMSGSDGISIHSSKEIYEKIKNVHVKNMSVFYMMLGILLVLGIFASTISLYSSIRLKGQSFAYLKALGMTSRDIICFVIQENLIYPVIGILFSIVPISICQMFFMHIRQMVDSGNWGSYYTTSVPWYHYVPYRYNLYEYNIVTMFLIIFLIYILVMLMASIPQIIYIRRQNIAKEFEINTF